MPTKRDSRSRRPYVLGLDAGGTHTTAAVAEATGRIVGRKDVTFRLDHMPTKRDSRPRRPYVLGLDAGGTHTTAAVAEATGRIVGRAVTGPANPTKVGLEAAQREILRAASAALGAAHARPVQLGAVCLGLAGGDRPQVSGPMLRWLTKILPARGCLLTTDARIALQAALGDKPGIVVVSGTGSIAYAQTGPACEGRKEGRLRDVKGHVRILRAGGWGVPFGDQGSGYDIGRRAVGAALAAHDRQGPATRLEAALRGALGLQDITEVVALALAPHEIAGLLPVVVRTARAGDPVARRLLNHAARDLAELALTLIKRLRWQRRAFPVACAGGVFQASVDIRRAFARVLHGAAPRAEVALLRRAPVEGAVALARSLVTGV